MGADTVFISYSHDSPEHSDHVLALTDALHRDRASTSNLTNSSPRRSTDGPRWCEEMLRPENAKFVLVICTPTYRDRVENKVAADEGRGVFWEGGDIYQYLYDDKDNTRFIPVLLGRMRQTTAFRFRWKSHALSRQSVRPGSGAAI